jgi:hypothetical protein
MGDRLSFPSPEGRGFPVHDRNPNTGAAPGQSAELKTADQTIYPDREHPSHVVLPVIPAKP